MSSIRPSHQQRGHLCHKIVLKGQQPRLLTVSLRASLQQLANVEKSVKTFKEGLRFGAWLKDWRMLAIISKNAVVSVVLLHWWQTN